MLKNSGENALKHKNSYYCKGKLLIIICSALIIIVCLCTGRYYIPLKDLFDVLVKQDKTSNTTAFNVLYHIRIPRICVSYVIGVALALSGTVYQSIFNNRLISPGILGVDSGACVGAGPCILLGFGKLPTTICAFTFGLFSAVLALAIQNISRSTSPLVLVLAGIIVSAFMNALIGLIKYIADSQNKLASITFWMLGDLSGAEMGQLYYMMPSVVVCTFVLYAMRWRINALSLGEKESLSLGINYRRERGIVILCATLLTSVSVSVAGAIGWVGLIIPNICRSLFGNDNQKIIPMSILFGGIFMAIVDTIARSISPNEIPLGIITGFLGAITYTAIIVKRRTYL